jgi:hypothetical protein
MHRRCIRRHLKLKGAAELGLSSAVDHLPGMHKALVQNPKTNQTKLNEVT